MSLKLTMIGPSGTGKSCYLYATYVRMLEGIGDFNFNCKDFNQGLDLENAWDLMLEDGVWPQGNSESSTFDFDCFWRGKMIGDFEWLDYRGGILLENMDQDNDNEVAQFIRRAQNSDALLVCLPVDQILCARSDSPRERNKWQKMKTRILAILGKALENNQNAALIFLITKADMCSSRDESRFCVQEVRNAFRRYFYETTEHVMITMTRLGRFEGTSENFQQGAKIVGDVDPHNVHLPILFPLYLDTVAAANEYETKARKERKGEQDYSQRASDERKKPFLSRIWWPSDYKIYEGKSLACAQSAEIHEKKARELRKIADKIWDELNGRVDIYHNGQCVVNASGVQ